MKIILNKCYGGFGLSKLAYEWLMKNKGWKIGKDLTETDSNFNGEGFYPTKDREELRVDLDVIECVETLGSKNASGRFGELRIIEIPDNANWEIDEYDGIESVRETSEVYG